MKSRNFRSYSSYYNLLYKDKDYPAEVNYVESLLNKYSKIPVSSLLNLGCGTGNHDFLFLDKGYKVTGVDLSADMIRVAKKKNKSGNYNGTFIQGNIRNLSIGENFDAVLALFHVMSYQTTNAMVEQTFLTAKKHLKRNGLFIFDCWYGPGVLTKLPAIRKKHFEDERIKIKRIALPEMHFNENKVVVNYKLLIEDKVTGQTKEIGEKHPMRYFFHPELQLFFGSAGFELVKYFQWMVYALPDNMSWNVCYIIRKP